jgi:hypothetical protein
MEMQVSRALASNFYTAACFRETLNSSKVVANSVSQV